MDAKTLVDYAASLDCIHCGLCLSSCPTYRLTGVESSSPRGRVHLMRSVAESELVPDAEYAEELDFCLLCRNCESVCPSGVRFGHMMEHARAERERALPRPMSARFARWLGFRVLLPHRFALRATAAIGRFAQRTGSLRAIASLLGARGRTLANAPAIPPAAERSRLPALTPAEEPKLGRVAMLEGCVMPELFGRVNRATAHLLSAVGFDVEVAGEHVCCGSLHAHNGDDVEAKKLAKRTIELFEALDVDRESPSAIVVNSAGCSAHMKEYAELLRGEPSWQERAEKLRARVFDFSEFLASDRCRDRVRSALASSGAASEWGKVTYDDPCHLCHGQQVRKPPRELLDSIPALARVEMADSESCCGSAGIYSLVRPEDAARVLAPKLESLAKSGADTLVTANPGCQIQWESGVARAGLDVRVVHLAEVLDRAIRARASVTKERA